MTEARLEDKKHWSPSFARLLCGKQGADGRYHCSGQLCLVYRPWPSFWFGEMELRSGVWRPGVEHFAGVSVQRRLDLERHERKQFAKNEGIGAEGNTLELTPGMRIPFGECPRCHEVQALLNEEDLKALSAVVK